MSVTFRMYGYNASTSSGGLRRMVFDDINVNGSNITFATITGIPPKQLNLIPYGKSLIIKSYLEGRCIFNLLSAAGANVMRKELFNSQGINSFSLFDLPAGIYYGTIANGKF